MVFKKRLDSKIYTRRKPKNCIQSYACIIVYLIEGAAISLSCEEIRPLRDDYLTWK
jgi:hypothetical protein